MMMMNETMDLWHWLDDFDWWWTNRSHELTHSHCDQNDSSCNFWLSRNRYLCHRVRNWGFPARVGFFRPRREGNVPHEWHTYFFVIEEGIREVLKIWHFWFKLTFMQETERIYIWKVWKLILFIRCQFWGGLLIEILVRIRLEEEMISWSCSLWRAAELEVTEKEDDDGWAPHMLMA